MLIRIFYGTPDGTPDSEEIKSAVLWTDKVIGLCQLLDCIFNTNYEERYLLCGAGKNYGDRTVAEFLDMHTADYEREAINKIITAIEEAEDACARCQINGKDILVLQVG